MLSTALSSLITIPFIAVNAFSLSLPSSEKLIASHTISLEQRHAVPEVNQVFKDNILLTIVRASGQGTNPQNIDWDQIRQPFTYRFTLEPNQTFAFHEDVLPEYQGKISKTTNSHFGGFEGFKSDGYLMGDGVCHLASLMYWVAKDAGLDAKSPTNHDFAVIPQIDRQYGVSIYNQKGSLSSSALQNLYVTNNRASNIDYEFKYDGKDLTISIFGEN